jgi:hypothetical protein
MEILQSIKASEMSPLLKRMYATDGGSEALDVLVKYMYATAPPLISKKLLSRVLDLTRAGRCLATREWDQGQVLPRHLGK